MAIRDDSVVIDDIAARLVATGLIADVVVGSQPGESREVAADRTSVAWIDRTGWEEHQAAAGFLTERTVRFVIWLSFRHVDPATCWRYLCQIEAVVVDALSGVSYAGLTQPSLSMLRRGEDQTARDGELSIKLHGDFRY